MHSPSEEIGELGILSWFWLTNLQWLEAGFSGHCCDSECHLRRGLLDGAHRGALLRVDMALNQAVLHNYLKAIKKKKLMFHPTPDSEAIGLLGISCPRLWCVVKVKGSEGNCERKCGTLAFLQGTIYPSPGCVSQTSLHLSLLLSGS